MEQSPPESQRFRRLYDDNVEVIRRYCYRRIPESEVDDATIEVFTVVWKRLSEAPSGDGVLPWVYGIAHNVVRNLDRTRRRRARLANKLGTLRRRDEPSAEIQVIRRIDDEAVLDAVRELRTADREILMLAAWEGLKPSEIASVLNIDAHAASMRLHRARNRLARRVGAPQLRTPIGTDPQAATEGGRP